MPAMDPTDYDIREVACPYCRAGVGAYCKRPSGHQGPFVDPHAARREAAYELWRAEEIKKKGAIVSDFLKPAPSTTATPSTAAPQPAPTSAQMSLFI